MKLRASLVVVGALLVGCEASSSSAPVGGPATTTTSATPAPPTTACALKLKEDLIERLITPGIPPYAIAVGDVSGTCKPTVDTIGDTTPSGPGYCTQIARAADNPGYNADANPAPALRKIVAQAGASCP